MFFCKSHRLFSIVALVGFCSIANAQGVEERPIIPPGPNPDKSKSISQSGQKSFEYKNKCTNEKEHCKNGAKIDPNKLYSLNVTFEGNPSFENLKNKSFFIDTDVYITENIAFYSDRRTLSPTEGSLSGTINVFAAAKGTDLPNRVTTQQKNEIPIRQIVDGRQFSKISPFHQVEREYTQGYGTNLLFEGLKLFNKVSTSVFRLANPVGGPVQIAGAAELAQESFNAVVTKIFTAAKSSDVYSKSIVPSKSFSIMFPSGSVVNFDFHEIENIDSGYSDHPKNIRESLSTYLGSIYQKNTTWEKCSNIGEELSIRGFKKIDLAFMLGFYGRISRVENEVRSVKQSIIECLTNDDLRTIFVKLNLNKPFSDDEKIHPRDFAEGLKWPVEAVSFTALIGTVLQNKQEPAFNSRLRSATISVQDRRIGSWLDTSKADGIGRVQLRSTEFIGLLTAKGIDRFECPQVVEPKANQPSPRTFTIFGIKGAAVGAGNAVSRGDMVKMTFRIGEIDSGYAIDSVVFSNVESTDLAKDAECQIGGVKPKE